MLIFVLFFPFLLRHDDGSHNSDNHRDGDDQDSNHLCNAELLFHRVVPVTFVQIHTSEVVVVVQEEPLDVTELLEDSLQIAVAIPWVSLEHYVSAVRVETQEGLELNRGEVVVGEVQQSETGQW